jgi:hypothetical protein
MEIWKEIPGWPEYECSSFGNVRRIAKGRGVIPNRILKHQKLKTGYVKVSLCRDSKRKEYCIHSLVMLTFVGERPKGMDVCHYNGIKTDNRIDNLRYDTRQNNQRDNVKNNRDNRGEKCGSHKWDRSIVIQIIKRSRNGEVISKVAREYGMLPGTAYGITSRRNWYWLTEEEINGQ